MKYRLDKKSGNQLSILGFGCMRLPGTMVRIDIEKSEQLFLKAIEGGVNYFDTAYLYPGSETVLGNFLDKHQLRDKIYIATKLPQALCRKHEDFERFFQEELKRLKTDHIDYYLIHNIPEFRQWQKLCDLGIKDWIDEKKRSGAIRQIGFSYHGNADDFILMLDDFDWDFCQIQYNYINIHYQAGVEGLKAAAKRGLSVIIMEPLLGGRLTTLPQKAVQVFKAADSKRSAAAWGLSWLWNQPEVTVVLSGMNQEEQLIDNLNTAGEAQANMFSDTEEKAVDAVIEIFNASYKIPCTGCNYCMPCPKGINIPSAFAAYNSSYAFKKGKAVQQYYIGAGVLSDQPHYASTCVKCGLCEKKCPQHIPIRQSLEDVNKRLETPLYKIAMRLVRRFHK